LLGVSALELADLLPLLFVCGEGMVTSILLTADLLPPNLGPDVFRCQRTPGSAPGQANYRLLACQARYR
jgi:hypothetical protein